MSELKPNQMFTQVQGKVKISTKSMNSNINVNGTTNSTKHVIIDKNTDFAAKVVPGGLHILYLLAVGSRDLSQAEKEITACKAEQIYKMTPIFT